MKIDLTRLNQKELHGLFMAAIVPRTRRLCFHHGEDGVFNLAAFSFFTKGNPSLNIAALGTDDLTVRRFHDRSKPRKEELQ